jgi:hypothetical protein
LARAPPHIEYAIHTVITMDAELYVAGTDAAQGNTADERYAVCKAMLPTSDGGPAAGPESTYQVFLGLKCRMPAREYRFHAAKLGCLGLA